MEKSLLLQNPVITGSPIIISELENRLKAKIRENEELKQKFDTLKKKADSQNEIYTQSHSELQIPSKSEQQAEIKSNYNQLSEEFRSLKNELTSIMERLEESQEKNLSYENQIKALLNENGKLNKLAQNNQLLIEALNKEKEEIISKYRSLEDFNDKRLKAQKEQENELLKLKTDYMNCKIELQEFQNKTKINEDKIIHVLEENTKLNQLCQENFQLVQGCHREKDELEKKCKNFEEQQENILVETSKFESKINEIEENYEKLMENYLLICSENDRLHQILEGKFKEEIDYSTRMYIETIENEKKILENECNKWKLEYTSLKYVLENNDELVRKNQELHNAINNLHFSQNIDEEKFQKVVSELVEKIKFLSIENERLNNIILNRCKEMMNSW